MMNYEYTTKPIILEAFQMTKERRWDNSEWPNWLHQAWNMDSSKYGSVSISEDNSEVLIIRQHGHDVVFINHDDWIVQDEHEELSAWKSRAFEANHQEVVS